MKTLNYLLLSCLFLTSCKNDSSEITYNSPNKQNISINVIGQNAELFINEEKVSSSNLSIDINTIKKESFAIYAQIENKGKLFQDSKQINKLTITNKNIVLDPLSNIGSLELSLFQEETDNNSVTPMENTEVALITSKIANMLWENNSMTSQNIRQNSIEILNTNKDGLVIFNDIPVSFDTYFFMILPKDDSELIWINYYLTKGEHELSRTFIR
ncbi:hypothetical protein [Saccharicrinis aurantiacus]|uniref:hypothetical protein n=1 Tax=Saccharicrinis aurantiacus TaxID=1849719 RepID=UPI00094F85B9|nr:hypothetical protein [Saccharicrinis aurantiacus]